MSEAMNFVELNWDDRLIRVEYQWIAMNKSNAPLIVFLHEGLGSLAMWKDFPQQLCDASGCRGLVYSRPGYGRSTPLLSDGSLEPDFMHRQAHEVLPGLLKALRVDADSQKPWLFGHSDGGTIALLYAAKFTDQIAGAIVLAPHILVEDLSLKSIELARTTYMVTDFRQRLAKYHDAPDSVFLGWSNIWLSPSFRDWNIETEIESITCPLLAVQGLEDKFGTLAQIKGIAHRVPQTELLVLSDCGHSPHRDQTADLIASACNFIKHKTGDTP